MGTVIASEFRAWLLIGVGVITITVLLALLFAPFFDVRHITIRRQDPRIDLQEIQQTLSPLFRERLLLVTKSQVSSLLHADYPDIDHIEITKEYPSTLTVSIFLEPLAAVVLVDDSNETAAQSGALIGSGSYSYITKSGFFISSRIKLASSSPLPTLRLTDWGMRPQHRSRALPREFIERIFTARDLLRTDFGLAAEHIVVYVRAEEFHIRTPKITFWFDLRSPLPEQFQRFREFLKTLSLDIVKQYIDLRIADKIIYK